MNRPQVLVKITSSQAEISLGRVVPVWNIYASRIGAEMWTLGADDGRGNHPTRLSQVEIISGDLTDFRFFILPGTDSAVLAYKILVDDMDLYNGYMDWDSSAYAEFHKMLAAFKRE